MTQASILVVEDESIVALEIKSRLEKNGYAVCAVAHDGETAVEQAQNTRMMFMAMMMLMLMRDLRDKERDQKER